MRAFRYSAPLMILAVLLSLAALAALTACGKKAWPEPIKAEDRFEFTAPKTVLAGGCLGVEVGVTGAVANLSELILEIGPDDCPDCPLRPSRLLRYDDPTQFMPEPGTVRVRACGLAPEAAVRWRLRGVNALSGMADASTGDSVAQPVPQSITPRRPRTHAPFRI